MPLATGSLHPTRCRNQRHQTRPWEKLIHVVCLTEGLYVPLQRVVDHNFRQLELRRLTPCPLGRYNCLAE